jgi:hypothetical protein
MDFSILQKKQKAKKQNEGFLHRAGVVSIRIRQDLGMGSLPITVLVFEGELDAKV